MLSNAYSLAKFRFDTADNEPAKNLQTFNFCKLFLKFCKICQFPKLRRGTQVFFDDAAAQRRPSLPTTPAGSPSVPLLDLTKLRGGGARCKAQNWLLVFY